MKQPISSENLRVLIEAARGGRECDLAIKGGFVINVFTNEILRADIGIVNGYIALVDAHRCGIEAGRTIDANNLFLAPGLIDSHMHLESSMLTPSEFAKAVLPLGTTAVVVDPHEIANVAGSGGIRELMEAAKALSLTFYFMIPPAVPASDLDTSGYALDAGDIAAFADLPNVLGIAEEMDFPGVLAARQDLLDKLLSMPGKVIDGHAPGLTGRDLQAYAAAGITSEHEAMEPWEGEEKLRAGLYLMIREGSAAHNLDDLAKLVTPATVDRCLLVTDDLSPVDILEQGHINHLLSRIVRLGVAPELAVRMVTLNAAQRFKLDRVGAIAPGYSADIVAFEDLEEFKAAFVIAKGEFTAVDGELVSQLPDYEFTSDLSDTVRLPKLTQESLAIPACEGQARVIQAIDSQLITKELDLIPAVIHGHVTADIENDVLKIVVVERHGKTGNVGLGLIRGFGIKSGAMAGSVSHDSHNIVAVGTNDADILRAIDRVGEMKGGLAVVVDGDVRADLPLPVGGLISLASASEVADRLQALEQTVRDLGCEMEHPFMTLSFMCLPVIPDLKITDLGLVDVNGHGIVPLFKESRESACIASG